MEVECDNCGNKIQVGELSMKAMCQKILGWAGKSMKGWQNPNRQDIETIYKYVLELREKAGIEDANQ